MFQFKWQMPGPTASEVVLRIHSRSGWLGRKTLTCGGQAIFRRGWFAGIETRFVRPADGRQLDLRLVPIPNSADWRPALFVDGQELPEVSGTAAPRVAARPRSIAVTIGLTYLIMLMALVTLPSIARILDALQRRADDRKLVLVIMDPAATPPPLLLEQANLPPATVGVPYSVPLQARGGKSPYTWTREGPNWPKDSKLDEHSGQLTFTPGTARDVAVAVKIADAGGQTATCALAFAIRSAQPRRADYPSIETWSLPPGIVGQPYEFTLHATGGTLPYEWSALGSKLPKGLSLDARTGVLTGTPAEANTGLQKKASDQIVKIAATDRSASYTPAQDIVPWLIPTLVTAVCLLGYASMRKWSVAAYGGLIVLQIVLGAAHVLPMSIAALVVQGVLWLTGVPHLGRMR